MSKHSNAAHAPGVGRAVDAFRDGQPVLVHDAADREGEVDLIYPAPAVTADAVARMRTDAGGLICVALGDAVADAFALPFIADELDHPAADHGHLGYDDRSSFSLTVNHRDTYTGITDDDRALTIAELGQAAADPAAVDFPATFRAPGHVHVLRAAPSLSARQGHTELGIALAGAAGVPPAVVVCEMLDADTGGARSVADAKRYASRHDIPYVEGSDLVAAFQ
ncbi:MULTISPECIES: 3,4-dihydroxy-2-butanone-4-phosphate synthase [Halobacterium]|uniref:3,4-dihydroxy-2-butanone 4-phosphate synthase n=6 Tax=Halobacterium salinarum TaxID=2242 RepID=A0A510N8F0_HALSA|nr:MULTISPECIES: 3,4-dihydroxy-2-butanone-4-phosphate synthase [Halobacterium]MBB6089282.1 3,4-dihydroxy 2-butanone 4-phosphate synthase [Halobacterium salinarum]MCF2165886.1 3,4-dihydroxy-2-butanone-4-phosphate synthase [Halobacterium salinarum]MCF2167345.1 3,4-dihydroxy-2-butanone-4-phosphate synthase [Halobacterium salinarum]MCF2207376.1 3,4-dihydroxy-2-butanone-4-phosphate synthase [Halobacterium salinarum]MCF2239533.1 3,4-dihydroxy-2-butanone-4-phosphate synthase [Halobacterium salinarum]